MNAKSPTERSICWRSFIEGAINAVFGILIGFGVYPWIDSHPLIIPAVMATPFLWPTLKLILIRKTITDSRQVIRLGLSYFLGYFGLLLVCHSTYGLVEFGIRDPELFEAIFVTDLLAGLAICLYTLGTLLVWQIILALFPSNFVQDGTLCPNCGYCLLGVQSMRCPECGNSFNYDDLETTEMQFRERSTMTGGDH